MKIKKNPRFALENYSKIFYEMGLLLSLFIVYSILESKTYHKIETYEMSKKVSIIKDVEEEIPIIDLKPYSPPPPPPPQQQVVLQKVVVVEDKQEIEEVFFKSTETDESEAVEYVEHSEYTDSSGIVEATEEEAIVEDVPFLIIEKAPVFPGCTGNQVELRKCFSEQLQKFFVRKFNAGLANELGLPRGRKRIVVLFKIDENGKITGIKARAPHIRLKNEAVRIIKSLPTMTPGKQRGRNVSVRYTLPISFFVE